ncbi:stage V sporulation protein K [Halobacillus andaensis]|uniref:Stage V sporulation protein K n=1 Tax=Halobacillus andaensis TaxID=1176239 RepID=A0A917B0Q0_HALAA|nr:AAA family ATPase [Halobacillus andaensis]MBP2003410.1 stage V sporulation protein K [Halobacillus andaensis]GGF10392.1 stage V sporulation protein K [Halobacillus andaensis]
MSQQAKLGSQNKINIVLKQDYRTSEAAGQPSIQKVNPPYFRFIENYFSSIVGLNDLKHQIKEIYAQVLIEQKRKEIGLKNNHQVWHMIFKGNPGTGKTTVARKVAQLFQEMNVLESGHLIEADRGELVGEYIGHTAQKTKDLITKSLGGILFIDEAYSLARGGEKDFGKEAIDTLVKCMEDYHDQLIIILAGYPIEMEDFLNMNPGLASRFPLQLNFHDYSANELSAIAKVMLREKDYVLTHQAERKLYDHLAEVSYDPPRNFANARYVRNLIEDAIRKHAYRLANRVDWNKKDLMMLEPSDFHFDSFD